MAAVSVSNPYGALTLALNVVGASESQTQLAAGVYVVGFIDEFNRARMYNPWAMGYQPQTGDAASKWLPEVTAVTLIEDPTGADQIGQAFVQMSPGTADLVNVASVQSVRVDARAIFIVASGEF